MIRQSRILIAVQCVCFAAFAASSSAHPQTPSKQPVQAARGVKAAAEAKANCPISRVLNAKITLTATLEA